MEPQAERHLQTALPCDGVPPSRELLMRRQIPIPLLREAFCYDPASGVLTWVGINRRMLGKRAGSSGKRYRKVCLGGVRTFEHRAIWAIFYGEWPTGEVDHINRDGHDNRIENLRLVTRSENCINRGIFKNNSLGVPRVKKTPNGKFQVRVQKEGRRMTVGTFSTLEEASKASASSIGVF